MKWLADENISSFAIRLLQEQGHDVVSIRSLLPSAPDAKVVELARELGCVLLTFDRDHGDLIFNQAVKPPPAVVYLRLYPASPEALSVVLTKILALGESALIGCFTVVTQEGLRQRRLP